MISQLKQWVKQMMDPQQRAARQEQKKAEQMAKFLERNEQSQQKDAS